MTYTAITMSKTIKLFTEPFIPATTNPAPPRRASSPGITLSFGDPPFPSPPNPVPDFEIAGLDLPDIEQEQEPDNTFDAELIQQAAPVQVQQNAASILSSQWREAGTNLFNTVNNSVYSYYGGSVATGPQIAPLTSSSSFFIPKKKKEKPMTFDGLAPENKVAHIKQEYNNIIKNIFEHPETLKQYVLEKKLSNKQAKDIFSALNAANTSKCGCCRRFDPKLLKTPLDPELEPIIDMAQAICKVRYF
jgi:hypothetical protein